MILEGRYSIFSYLIIGQQLNFITIFKMTHYLFFGKLDLCNRLCYNNILRLNNKNNEDILMIQRAPGPDFVGVGVQKSGSTWLTEVLRQHPEVFLPKKEIDFYSRKFRKGYSWYHNWFSNKGDRVAGEFTPLYLISPLRNLSRKSNYPEWVPPRLYFWRKNPSARDELKAHYPGIRVFAIFRNPIDRAWSYYWFRIRIRKEGGRKIFPFEKMWNNDGRWIRTNGLYAQHLACWREAFPNFGVFFYEDIKRDPFGLARAIYRFIGVDDKFTPDINHWPLKGEYEPMPPSIREMLVDFYREQILIFSAMTGRDLSHWLYAKEASPRGDQQ